MTSPRLDVVDIRGRDDALLCFCRVRVFSWCFETPPWQWVVVAVVAAEWVETLQSGDVNFETLVP